MKIASLLVATLLMCPDVASAQMSETGFLDRTVVVEGNTYLYQVYIPRNYSPAEAWPVTLFLHGAGERGDNGMAQTHVGLGRAIRFNPERWPMIAVFPQVPNGMSWQGLPADVAMAALDATIDEYRVDDSRVYLTGLSLGGNGTWYLGYHHADRFAALVPICGFVGGSPRFPSFVPETPAGPYADLADRISNIPVWIFHGGADQVVPAEESREMAAALEAIGAEVQYEEFPDVGHNAWDPAYANEELAAWLLGQRKR